MLKLCKHKYYEPLSFSPGYQNFKPASPFGSCEILANFHPCCLWKSGSRRITPFPFDIQWWYFTPVLPMTGGRPLLIFWSKGQHQTWKVCICCHGGIFPCRTGSFISSPLIFLVNPNNGKEGNEIKCMYILLWNPCKCYTMWLLARWCFSPFG